MTTASETQVTDDLISIYHDGEVLDFDKDYLKGWIEDQLTDHKQPTEITVTCIGRDGLNHEVQLTTEIWQEHLTKGPGKAFFVETWDIYTRARTERRIKLKNLESRAPNFRVNCKSFIHDLRNFGQNKGSRTRIEQTGHQYYLGQPYFNDELCDEILALPIYSGSLREALGELEQKRLGGRIYASHDLSPIFEAALGITWDKTQNKAVIAQL